MVPKGEIAKPSRRSSTGRSNRRLVVVVSVPNLSSRELPQLSTLLLPPTQSREVQTQHPRSVRFYFEGQESSNSFSDLSSPPLRLRTETGWTVRRRSSFSSSNLLQVQRSSSISSSSSSSPPRPFRRRIHVVATVRTTSSSRNSSSSPTSRSPLFRASNHPSSSSQRSTHRIRIGLRRSSLSASTCPAGLESSEFGPFFSSSLDRSRRRRRAFDSTSRQQGGSLLAGIRPRRSGSRRSSRVRIRPEKRRFIIVEVAPTSSPSSSFSSHRSHRPIQRSDQGGRARTRLRSSDGSA